MRDLCWGINRGQGRLRQVGKSEGQVLSRSYVVSMYNKNKHKRHLQKQSKTIARTRVHLGS